MNKIEKKSKLVKAAGSARSRGRPRVKDPTEKNSISLPKSMWMRLHNGEHLSALSDEDRDFAGLGEYFSYFAAQADELGYGSSVSGIIRMALDEMWRRRLEPDRTSSESLTKYGVESVAADFFDIDFADKLTTSDEIVLQTSSLSKILTRSGVLPALVQRMRSGKKTTFVLQYYQTAEGAQVADKEQSALKEMLTLAGSSVIRALLEEESTIEDDPLRERKRFSFFLKPAPQATNFEQFFWTDSECFSAPSYLIIAEKHPAIRYVPSRRPAPYSSHGILDVKGDISTVTVSSDSSDYHRSIRTGLSLQLMRGGILERTEHVLRIQLSKFPVELPQPTP